MACLLVGQGASLPDNNDDQSALNMLLGPNHDGQLEPLPALLLTMWDLPEFIGLRPTHSNVVGHSGDTPLHVAVRWKDLEAVKLLLAACADPNVRGDESYTPLHSACSDADPAMVELLISYGADLFAETRGNLPFTIARLFRHDHLCDLLGKYRDNARATDPQVSIKSRIR